jgi:hypothetical protein
MNQEAASERKIRSANAIANLRCELHHLPFLGVPTGTDVVVLHSVANAAVDLPIAGPRASCAGEGGYGVRFSIIAGGER